MGWKDQSIKLKLALGFGIAIVATIAVGIIGFLGIQGVNTSLKNIMSRDVPLVEMANEMKTTLMASRKTLEEYMTAADISMGSDANSMTSIKSQYDNTIDEFDIFVSATLNGGEVEGTYIEAVKHSEMRGLLEQTDSYHNEKFQNAANEMLEAINTVISARNTSWKMMEQMEDIFNEVYSDLERLENDFDQELTVLISRANSTNSYRQIIEDEVPMLDSLVELKVSLAESRIILEEYMQLNDPNELAELQSEYAETIASFDLYVNAILNGGIINGARVNKTDNVILQEGIKEIDGDHSEFQDISVQLFEARDYELSQSIVAMEAMEKLDTYGDEAAILLTQFEILTGDEMNKAKVSGEENAERSIFIAIVVTILALIFCIIVGIQITRGIVNPLEKCVSLASRIADGDLTRQLDVPQKDEIGQLADSLGKMQNQLISIVTDIRDSAGNVSSGSQQLSTSAQQISEGTTEQAASGEEVSSSMEQMSSNIENNAVNASATAKIADDSNEMVTSGSRIVNDTVSAMNVIADKISIIEEIAKQTNLLALNAAIEAARAGDQGKGFAVVASEVRKLAENSQKAALDISELSTSSVVVAEKAGKIFADIVPATQKTSDLVKEINSSSNEQKIGTQQIMKAMSQLDQVIQQNASAAEEMAAMAEELAGQALSLTRVISFFKTDSIADTMMLPEPSSEIINSADLLQEQL